MPTLKFGLVYAFRTPSGDSRILRSQYCEALNQIKLAEELGFSTVLVCEHHFAEDGFFPSPMVAAAGIATNTDKIRLGPGLTLLPLHNVVRVAEDAAVLDVISNGRLVLGLGFGWRDIEFENFGIKLSERYSRMEEGITLIRKLWEGEEVTYEGHFTRLRNTKLAPRPIQKPSPPIWVGGKHDSAVKLAARLGDSWLPPPNMDIETLREKLQTYRGELQSLGRLKSVAEYPLYREGYVSLTSDLALDEVREPLMYTRRKYWEWWHREGWDENAFFREYQQKAMIGSPEDFIAAAEKYSALGITEILIDLSPPGLKSDKVRRAITLIGKNVIPHFS